VDPKKVMQDLCRMVGPVCEELEHAGEGRSCIFAAAVLLRVLRHKGYTAAYPLTARAIIYNPKSVERLRRWEAHPTDPAAQREWLTDGCRWLGLGVGTNAPPPGHWLGHLVVVLPNLFGDRHAVCDLTLAQASKPEWGIELGPACIRVPDTFTKGATEFKASFNGSLVVYLAFPDDRSYEATQAWTNNALCQSVAARVLSAKKQHAPGGPRAPGRRCRGR
jgi:hypothetical protein